MKMSNVFAATLALLIVSNGVQANEMVMAAPKMQNNGALPEFGIKNELNEHVIVTLIMKDNRSYYEGMMPNDVLPIKQNDFYNLKEVHVKSSSGKGKAHKFTTCHSNEMRNPMMLIWLDGNTLYNFLVLTDRQSGHTHLMCTDRTKIEAPYQIIPLHSNTACKI